MKKTLLYTALTILSLVSITSCSDDDNNDFPKTNLKGKPSNLSFKIKTDGETKLSYSYENDNISKIESNSYYSKFEYKDGELYSIHAGQLDANIADGNSYQIFEREGNRVVIDVWGELSFNIYRFEIVLNNNNVPTKITDLGVFSRDEKEDLTQGVGGYHYSILNYDSSNKKLMKQRIYRQIDSVLIYEVDYAYDNNPGLFSKVNIPLWYIAYRAFECLSNLTLGSDIYMNNMNNLLSKKVFIKESNTNVTVNYTFKYDATNYPISVSSDSADEGDYLTIEY